MAKPKKQAVDRSVHLAANKDKRAKRHAKRMAKQQACPTRGKARAIRRWVESVSREWPKVLHMMQPSQLVRTKAKSKGKGTVVGKLLINGKEMGSLAEAQFTVREMLLQRKAEGARLSV